MLKLKSQYLDLKEQFNILGEIHYFPPRGENDTKTILLMSVKYETTAISQLD